MGPPADSIKDDLKRLHLRRHHPGSLDKYGKPHLGDRPEKDQGHMQRIAAHAASATTFHTRSGKGIKPVERRLVGPQGEKEPSRNRFSHAAVTRRPP